MNTEQLEKREMYAGFFERILPTFLASITGPREKIPHVVWSSKSWVHNIFRVYELVFWRRSGIRAEIGSYIDKNGNHVQEAYTFEAACALIETRIRYSLSSLPKLKLVRVEVPMFAFAGLPTSRQTKIPYLFAIAFDAASGAFSIGSTSSGSHTVTGTNPFLVAYTYSNGGLATATYNSVSMVAIVSDVAVNGVYGQMLVLSAPTTGANTLAGTPSGAAVNVGICGVSYSGVNQANSVDSSAVSTGASVATLTVSTNVVSSNCWTILGAINATGQVAGTGSTERVSGASANGRQWAGDSNAIVGTGSQSLQVNCDAANNIVGVMASIAPPGGGGATTKSIPALLLMGVGQ